MSGAKTALGAVNASNLVAMDTRKCAMVSVELSIFPMTFAPNSMSPGAPHGITRDNP